MKAIRFSFLIALMVCLMPMQSQAIAPVATKKPVQAVLEFYPNYAGHLLGVARIGYDSPYAEKFAHTIHPEDLDYLETHAKLLEWSAGDEGALTYFFITFPGYVNPASKKHLAEYLTDLNSAIAQKSFDQFKEKYAYYIQELELWNGFNDNEQVFKYSDEIQTISKIMMNNYDAFRETVWPEYENYMSRLADAMNEKFDDWDLISRWEKLTGLEYKAPYYRVSLSLGMENGPTHKTLGYDKNWCYFGGNPTELLHQICRETGYRMLSCLCSEKYDHYDPNLCFEVFQTMADYFTDQIFADLGLDDKIKKSALADTQLYAIFEVIADINPDLKMDRLYSIALDTYSRTKFASNSQ